MNNKIKKGDKVEVVGVSSLKGMIGEVIGITFSDSVALVKFEGACYLNSYAFDVNELRVINNKCGCSVCSIYLKGVKR